MRKIRKGDEVIAYLEKARAAGLKITHDQYVYTASSTGLRQLIPDSALEGTREDFVNRLKHPAQMAEIIKKMKDTLKRSGRSDYGYAVIARLPFDVGDDPFPFAEAERRQHFNIRVERANFFRQHIQARLA